jgi:hypothetical protein
VSTKKKAKALISGELLVKGSPSPKAVINHRKFIVNVDIKNCAPGEVCARAVLVNGPCVFEDGTRESPWKCKVVSDTSATFRLILEVGCHCASESIIITPLRVEGRDSTGRQGSDTISLEVQC